MRDGLEPSLMLGTDTSTVATPDANVSPLVGSRLSTVAASASVYAITSALTVLVPVILLPVLTHYLTPEDYGVVAMFQVLLGLYAAVVGLNVDGAVAREYFNAEIADYPAFVSSCVVILIVTGAMAFALSVLFKSLIVGFAQVPAFVVLATPLVALAQGGIAIRSILWQVQARPIPFGLLKVGLSLLQVVLTVWLVVVLRYGWQGRVVAFALASFLCMTVSLALARRDGLLPTRIRRDYIQRALAFGVPLVPHIVGSWAVAMVDRVLVTTLVGMAATGVYSVGVQLGMAVGLLEDACNKAWVPWFFEQMESGHPGTDWRVLRIAGVYATLLIGAAALLAAITHRILPIIAGPKFQGAAPYVFWIALGYSFSGIYKVGANYLFFYRRTGIIASITITTGIIGIVLSISLIKQNGALGAAQGACASFFLAMVFTSIAAVHERRRALMPDGRAQAGRLIDEADSSGVVR
jgi:O-antigen/teichoic acid export membrane protein